MYTVTARVCLRDVKGGSDSLTGVGRAAVGTIREEIQLEVPDAVQAGAEVVILIQEEFVHVAQLLLLPDPGDYCQRCQG